MDTEHFQETLDYLAVSVAGLLEDHHMLLVGRRPITFTEQVRWVRTLQQFGRDVDSLCEASAVLLRRVHDTTGGEG